MVWAAQAFCGVMLRGAGSDTPMHLRIRRCPHMNDNRAMSGIQFVTDEKGRKVGVLIGLKKHGAIWEDFWDGLMSESRRKEKAIPYEQYRANRLKRPGPRG